MEETYGLRPEKRLFMQLIHACIRARVGQEAVGTYELMLRMLGQPATEVENSKVVQACGQFNMFEPACQFLDMIFRNGGSVGEREIQVLVDKTVGRKKAVADSILEVCKRHGVLKAYAGVGVASANGMAQS